MAKIRQYDGTGWIELIDTSNDQSITGTKIFADGKIIVSKRVGQVSSSVTQLANGVYIDNRVLGPNGVHVYGTLLYPMVAENGDTETIATQEWVQSQGGGGGGSQQYLHTVTIEELEDGAYYTFTFCFLSDYNTPIEDIEGLYNYLLDETNNLDAYGSGSFCNLTYAGTSTENRVYDANRIMIENNTLFIEGYAMFSSQMLARIDKAKAFICYGDQSDYWGWNGRVIDNVTPA